MIRLILATILFLLSLLTIFKAPTNFFWRVSVGITEFPYVTIFLSLILFAFSFSSPKYKLAVNAINLFALVLFFIPIIKVYQRGKNLPSELNQVFPSENIPTQLKQPFAFTKMFSGIGITEVVPRSIVYKQAADKTLNLDFYPSNDTAKSPCIVVIHGGSWAQGDSKQLPNLNSYLANRGYHVASINYRLAPENKSPAPVIDTRDAIKFLTENSTELNIDTNNFILLGRSAGGQIALVAAYTFHQPNVKGVISFYAPADMEWGATIKTNKWVLDVDKVFGNYLGGTLKEVPEKYKEATACEFVSSQSPPTLIIHGENDAMVAFEHSNRLVKKLNENKVEYYFLDLSWATHGCDYNINGPSGQITTFAIERFINSVTRK